jgi:hypothetical protein
VILFLTDGPEYKRKRGMTLKKDLSFILQGLFLS